MLERRKNEEYRSREYLTIEEVKVLIEAAGNRGRHKQRDYCLLLLMFRHGLRAGEACRLKWDAIMFERRIIYINRLKGSLSGNHPLQSDEIEGLKILRERYKDQGGYYVFVNERGKSLTVAAIQKIVSRAADAAELPIKVHPHMMRHSCGYFLADQGRPTRDIQAYLGHTNIQHTVRYTAQNPKRFESFDWDW
ncbi:tyrosine-type recombinase/integrase [Nodularia sp. UHCC 0506]|uniref:tyrosine-type recombinase/integrase n=1 Tax=Nostocales TaxID=1161 RepID=UPI002B1F2187|nr:tyrosine-type recombinase/integrase [Nodularia sp. UHCC 0506]MEA5516762.1 tyrosine-type recombinase/integrase [Nodularia sp. UHCC 0506]